MSEKHSQSWWPLAMVGLALVAVLATGCASCKKCKGGGGGPGPGPGGPGPQARRGGPLDDDGLRERLEDGLGLVPTPGIGGVPLPGLFGDGRSFGPGFAGAPVPGLPGGFAVPPTVPAGDLSGASPLQRPESGVVTVRGASGRRPEAEVPFEKL